MMLATRDRTGLPGVAAIVSRLTMLAGTVLVGPVVVGRAAEGVAASRGGLGADDWPAWRGPTHDGHAAAGQAGPLTWSAGDNVRWVVDVPGRGSSSPTDRRRSTGRTANANTFRR